MTCYKDKRFLIYGNHGQKHIDIHLINPNTTVINYCWMQPEIWMWSATMVSIIYGTLNNITENPHHPRVCANMAAMQYIPSIHEINVLSGLPGTTKDCRGNDGAVRAGLPRLTIFHHIQEFLKLCCVGHLKPTFAEANNSDLRIWKCRNKIFYWFLS